MNNFSLEEIKKQAKLEIQQEQFELAVEKEKERLKTKKSIFDTIFPYRILFIRKENKNGNR